MGGWVSKPLETMSVSSFEKSDRLLFLIDGRKVVDATDYFNKNCHPGGNNALLLNNKKGIDHHLFFHSSKSRRVIFSLVIATIEKN